MRYEPNWTKNCFEGGHTGQIDLQNMENNFACLRSLFSGPSQPADTIPGMPWFDTTNKLLKHRNYSDSTWRGILAGSASLKIWVMLVDAEDGWTVDDTYKDQLLALKSDSGVYSVVGGNKGTWTQPNHTHTGPNHVHSGPNHTHPLHLGTSGNNFYWDHTFTSGTCSYTRKAVGTAESGSSITQLLCVYMSMF